MTVGERMKHRRKQLGLNAEQVAAKLGVSPSTVYRYENGSIEKMGIDKLAPIADALQTTPAYLMGWEEPEVPTAPEIPIQLEDALEGTGTLSDAIKQKVRPDQKINLYSYLIDWIATAEKVDQGVLELLYHSGQTVAKIRETYLKKNPQVENFIGGALRDQILCQDILTLEYTGSPLRKAPYFKEKPRAPTYEFTLYVLIEKVLRFSPDERLRLLQYLDSEVVHSLFLGEDKQ